MPAPLMRPSRLAFPGVAPGFDPSHVAARGVVPGKGISAIAAGNTFRSLLDARAWSVTGGAQTAIINGSIGSSVNYPGTDYNELSGQASFVPTAITFAAIFVVNSTASQPTLFSDVNNYFFGLQSGTGVPVLFFSDFHIATAITLVAGVPYFMVGSTAGGVTNWLVKNLANGTIQTQTVSGGASPSASLNSTVRVSYSSNPAASAIAAVMAAYNNWLSPQQLLQWAQDPWSFWYPQKFDIGMMLGGAGAATPSGTLAATETPDVAAFTGSYSVASSFALTEGQDVAAFAGNYAVAASFALTEGADVAAFAGDFAGIATGTLAATEAPDIAAFAITNASVLADTHDGFSRRAIEDDDDGPIEEIVRPVPEKVRASIERARARIEGNGNLTMAQATAAVTLIDSIEDSVAYAGPEPRLVAELVASLNKVAADISKVEQASAINRLRRIEQDLDDERASMILLGAYPGETRWQMQTH